MSNYTQIFETPLHERTCSITTYWTASASGITRCTARLLIYSLNWRPPMNQIPPQPNLYELYIPSGEFVWVVARTPEEAREALLGPEFDLYSDHFELTDTYATLSREPEFSEMDDTDVVSRCLCEVEVRLCAPDEVVSVDYQSRKLFLPDTAGPEVDVRARDILRVAECPSIPLAERWSDD